LISIGLFTFAVVFILLFLVIVFLSFFLLVLLILIRVLLLLSLLNDLPLLATLVLKYNRSIIELRLIQQFLKGRRIFLIGWGFIEELAQCVDLMCW
jgi:hypothetical protein